jgi:hypothetical protein
MRMEKGYIIMNKCEYCEVALEENHMDPVSGNQYELGSMGECSFIHTVERCRTVLITQRNDARASTIKYRCRKDDAYTERNRVVAVMMRMAIAMGWRAGIGVHEDKPGEDWDPEWRTIVCVDTPEGQASWHVHDTDAYLFSDLPKYEGKWDGHTTEEKYARLQILRIRAQDVL